MARWLLGFGLKLLHVTYAIEKKCLCLGTCGRSLCYTGQHPCDQNPAQQLGLLQRNYSKLFLAKRVARKMTLTFHMQYLLDLGMNDTVINT